MRTFTARAAAEKIGCSRMTLYNWFRLGRIRRPEKVLRSGHRVLVWTPAEIRSVRAAMRSYVPKRFGQPQKIVNALKVAQLRAAGLPWRIVARAVGVCIPVARRALQKAQSVRMQ